MATRQAVEGFLAQKRLALAGASRKGRKFGNLVLKSLRKKGYEVFPIHPTAEELSGVRCYPSLAELPKEVGGLVLVVPPAQTEKLVQEAAAAGIKRIWMQQGAESPEAINFCEQNGITAVHGECIMMFAEPTAFLHRFHRWLWGVFGKLPKDAA
jgi:predicted CoA-binding protein